MRSSDRQKRAQDRDRRERPSSRFFDLALALALVFMAAQTVGLGIESSNLDSDVRLVSTQARRLHAAIALFAQRNGNAPRVVGADGLDPVSLDPLRSRGYYRAPLTQHLLHGRLDAYDAPAGEQDQRGFWLEMTLASDPSIRFLVARSDQAPMGGGRWLDGAYIYRNGTLQRL